MLPVEYTDVFSLADGIEKCVVELYQDFGSTLPHFLDQQQQSAERAKLFWATYLRGASA
jgi:hypothetical protein